MKEAKRSKGTLTIYDVASRAGVSIASVSRVLNGQGTPRADTRERVMRAVRELSFVPDGAARALSNGLKEVVGRRLPARAETHFEDEDESLLFIDVINRGIEVAAQRRGFDVLISSVGFNDDNVPPVGSRDGRARRTAHPPRPMLSAVRIARLASIVPVVTLAGSPTAVVDERPAATTRRGCAHSSITSSIDHGYRSVAYLSGRRDSPDNRARARVFEAAARRAGADVQTGPAWQGNYSAAGGAQVIASLLDAGVELPRAIVCANDQTALGVDPRARAAGHQGAGRRCGDRLRRRPRGTSPAPVAHHRPPAHAGAGCDRIRRPLLAGSADRQRKRTSSCRSSLMLRESCGCAQAAASPSTQLASRSRA